MYFNQGINWVQGENAAKSWYVPAGQTALLMDSEEQKFYLKTADASGIPLPLRVFAYSEVKEAPKGDPPPVMMELYEYLHGKHIEDATAVKVMQNTFKGVA